MRTSHRINMEEELLTGSTCKRNFSQDQHARGTSHRINIHQELFTVSTCNRNFSQDQNARGTPFRINMHEELFTEWTCTRNFSKDQHARGTSHRINMHLELLTVSTCKKTSHRINMQEELLTESTCKRTFWSACGCFSLDVKLYRRLSISPILLLSIFPFCHYCQLFSYYSILFTSFVNCLEPWLSVFQTMHDLRF